MNPVFDKSSLSGAAFVCASLLAASPSAAFELTADISKYNYHETNESGNFYMEERTDISFMSVGVRDWDRPGAQGDFGLMYTGEITYGKTAYRGSNSGTQNKPYYKGRVEAYGTYRINAMFTPFVGLGYRHLLDDSGGTVPSRNTNPAYDRKSQYFYMPIGARLDLHEDVFVKAQFNYFLKGNQTSYTSDTHDQYPDVMNEQDQGWGFDIALNYQITPDWSTYGFYRHWDISKSEIATGYVPVRGENVAWWEPDNTTNEAGVGLAYRF